MLHSADARKVSNVASTCIHLPVANDAVPHGLALPTSGRHRARCHPPAGASVALWRGLRRAAPQTELRSILATPCGTRDPPMFLSTMSVRTNPILCPSQ